MTFLLITLLVFFSCPCAFAQGQQSFEMAYKRGKDLYTAHHYGEAIPHLSVAAYGNADLRNKAFYLLGLCYFKDGKLEEATQSLQYVLDHALAGSIEKKYASELMPVVNKQSAKMQTTPPEPPKRVDERGQKEALTFIKQASERAEKILQAANDQCKEVRRKAQEELDMMDNRNFYCVNGLIPGFTDEEKKAVWQTANQKIETIKARAKEEADEIMARAEAVARRHLKERGLSD